MLEGLDLNVFGNLFLGMTIDSAGDRTINNMIGMRIGSLTCAEAVEIARSCSPGSISLHDSLRAVSTLLAAGDGNL